MEAQEVIRYIQTVSKKTPVKVYLNVTESIEFKKSKVFGEGSGFVVSGDYETIAPVLGAESKKIIETEIETAAKYSTVPLLDIRKVSARIEPGVIIKDQVSIGNNAMTIMGAIINIGAVIGENTMTDIDAILGGRATMGKNCHIDAGTVLTDVIGPAPAKLVIVEDGISVDASAVIAEGVYIGKDTVVAAGTVVLEDVAAGAVVNEIPACALKISDDQTEENTALIVALRRL